MSKGGFSFENTFRNAALAKSGVKMPITKKTGTTIVGIIFKDGVILGADTRATEGPIVCDKNCEKIHFISKNIYCCGAGTAADTEYTTALISSKLELHRLATGKEPRVVTAKTMLSQTLFKYQGHISAALVLGGVDSTGAHLYTIFPHGSASKLPFVTMGSGSLAAMGIFEAGFRAELPRAEGVELVKRAILAGITNDLGSGSNVDVCVITKDGVEFMRNMDTTNSVRTIPKMDLFFKPGTTAVISEDVRLVETDVVDETAGAAVAEVLMDTSE